MAPFWVTPLLLLPGVGLLVMSTQARYGQLHEEMHRLLEHGHHDRHLGRDLLRRGRLFRNALVCLYIACALYSLGALLGAVADKTLAMAELAAFPLTVVGCTFLVTASFILIREATLSLQILEYHDKELRERPPGE